MLNRWLQMAGVGILLLCALDDIFQFPFQSTPLFCIGLVLCIAGSLSNRLGRK